MLKLEYQNFFATLLIIFKVPTKLFWWSNKIIFRSVSSKILDLSAKSFFSCRIETAPLFISLQIAFMAMHSICNTGIYSRYLWNQCWYYTMRENMIWCDMIAIFTAGRHSRCRQSVHSALYEKIDLNGACPNDIYCILLSQKMLSQRIIYISK